jgi:putative DNA primase/helicase
MNSPKSRHFALESTAKALCDQHGGKWNGSKGMACCPAHDDRTPSLSITLGEKAILFHCFAGCSNQAVLAAFERTGTSISKLFGQVPLRADHKNPKPSQPSRAALALWNAAKPLLNSPAKAYLEARGITASSSQLRFHPLTPKGRGADVTFLPAMIAAVSLDEGPVAIHRTFLTLTSGIVDRAAQAKMALGALGQGAVRLFAPKDGELGLAEGIETAMAARALTGIPVWAVLSAGRLGRVAIPDSVTKLHLFIDFDDAGANAAEK